MNSLFRHMRLFILALAVAGVAPGAFATDSDSGGEEQSASGESVVPPLVKGQQDRYRMLRSRFWNSRDLPAGVSEPTGPVEPRDSNVNAVGISVRNIDFVLDNGIGYHVERLEGALVPVDDGEPVNFDEPGSFRIRIFSGEVLVRPRDLDALFNRYLLTYEPRSLSSIASRSGDGRLTVDVGARLFRFIPPVGGLPNTLSGPVTATDDNRLVFAPQSVESLGLPLKPLLSATGLKLATLTPFERPAVELSGNRLILDPERLFPPPRLAIDTISEVRLTDAGLRLTFTSDTSSDGFAKPPIDDDSYVWMQGGDARFYGALLVNARLAVTSEDDRPLVFHLYDYRAHTAAGRISVRRDGTLVARVPHQFEDADDQPTLTRGAAPRTFGGGR